MSVVNSPIEKRAPFQPFQCPQCLARFTRAENLKRHAALHNRSQGDAALPCEHCNATFSRPDLRHRHMKKKHADLEENRPRTRRQSPRQARARTRTQSQAHTPPQFSLDDTQEQQLAPSVTQQGDIQFLTDIMKQQEHSTLPTDEMTGMGPIGTANFGTSPHIATALLDPSHSFGVEAHQVGLTQPAAPFTTTDLSYFSFDKGSPDDDLFSLGLPFIQEDWFPSSTQITLGCNLFFKHISPFVPFIHQATFDPIQTAHHLLLSMLCLAYQYSDDPDCGDQAGSGDNLSLRCYQRARILIAGCEEKLEDDSTAPDITMVQTYLLLQIYTMMYRCGRKDSAYGLKTHSKMISLVRSGGLVHPTLTSSLTTTEDLYALWQEFIQAESHKRTFFAVHQIDTLWYQFLSIPRSLSHLEIKQDLPCPEDYWTATSSVQWAHRRLVKNDSGLSVKYPEAIRRFLSPDQDISSLPAFDPYGAINITHFLVSSAREISGWSTMTGMLSIERLEPLRLSLLALQPIIRSHDGGGGGNTTQLCEATWETAMIELQLWSPSHTGGIVEGSMDAVVNQLTSFSSSWGGGDIFLEPETAKSIQPHVNWFLHYLDVTPIPDAEAPWVVLYAYKAFIIAWQLLRGGVAEDAMQVVGVADGDMEAALLWAKVVFGRRQRWQLGKIIMNCLNSLGN